APTVDVVDQVRSKLHAIDVQVLTEQVRTAERTRLHQSLLIFDLDDEVESRLQNMLHDSASGLLRWRIDNLCQSTCTIINACMDHHRQTAKSTPHGEVPETP